MTPFGRSHTYSYTSSYSTSIVTMAVSCIVFDIQRDIGRKTPICHTSIPFNLHDQTRAPLIFSKNFNTKLQINCPSTRPLDGAKYCAKILPKSSNLLYSRVQQRHRQTDRRQTDLRQHKANVTFA